MEAAQGGNTGISGRWARLPRWAKWTIGIVGVLLLLGIGGAIGSSGEDEIKSELADVESELLVAENERDKATSAANAVLDRKEEIMSRARSEASDIVDKARSEQPKLEGKLSQLRGEVDTAEEELASTETSLEGAEREEALSSFGDGIWQAETDYVPGTYRTDGGNGCYWAKLNSAETFDIADNNNGVGQQVVAIDTPYFQTEGCGTWERIGE